MHNNNKHVFINIGRVISVSIVTRLRAGYPGYCYSIPSRKEMFIFVLSRGRPKLRLSIK
jgi:hypothetical protein